MKKPILVFLIILNLVLKTLRLEALTVNGDGRVMLDVDGRDACSVHV